MSNLRTNFRLKYKPKIGPSQMRQVVNPRPQTSQGELVAKTETLLIFRFSKRKFVGRNILGRWTILETVAHTLNKTSDTPHQSDF